MQASEGEQGALSATIRYLKTRKGMTMAGEIVLCLLAIICKAASEGCFIGFPIVEMVLATFMLIIFSWGLDKKFYEVHWLWSDFFRAMIASPLLLITSMVCFAHTYGNSTAIMAEIFALGAGVLFGYDALLGFSIVKGRKIANTDQTTSGQNGVGAQQNGVGEIIIA
ncbi:proteolipid protein 2-like [Clupea harengus]|uniref:Proteolipid protein 2 n=1 Tax=Clupea harengus TaxID=7950 RepID=A0A8M1KI62_CLUHA|nr:proteolipid protein 2-like [Clupea harengus]XP_042563567.1 proteolipid protein 2-like [Clupea harengus]